jgi:hypothetical protein
VTGDSELEGVKLEHVEGGGRGEIAGEWSGEVPWNTSVSAVLQEMLGILNACAENPI